MTAEDKMCALVFPWTRPDAYACFLTRATTFPRLSSSPTRLGWRYRTIQSQSGLFAVGLASEDSMRAIVQRVSSASVTGECTTVIRVL